MTTTEMQQTATQILTQLKKRQLKPALDGLRNWLQTIHLPEYIERVDEIENHYRMMLQYAVDGVNDPQRDLVYHSLIRNAFQLTDTIKEELFIKFANGYDYAQIRFYRPQLRSLNAIVSSLEEQTTNKAVAFLIQEGLNAQQAEDNDQHQQHEQTRNELFRSLWLMPDSDMDSLRKMFANDGLDSIDKLVAVSALTLSLLRRFNPDYVMLIADLCQHQQVEIRQRAMVGLALVLTIYNARITFYDTIRQRLQLLTDDPAFSKAMVNVIIQFTRTAETDKISQRMQQEILPEMMKIAPQMKDKIDLENMSSLEEVEDKNPEWQEMIEKSGIGDKLREMSELQMEGADVYMNTFAQLKHYPFFNDPANWFLPFDPSHSNIENLLNENNQLIEVFLKNTFLCNSDKYSLLISMQQIPDMQRKSMMQAFKIESDQMKELKNSELTIESETYEKQLSNQYIQDLYRFFNLFPNRKDFTPIFNWSLRFHASWFFGELNLSYDQQIQIAEYYFSKEYYSEAYELFATLSTTHVNANLFQKMGYCKQQNGEYDAALDLYLKAEALTPEQKWLTRKIAQCYKMLRNYEEALNYYKRVEVLDPENRNVQLQIGHLLVQEKHYTEALNYYFKVELATSSPKVWRAIAWCSFLSNKYKQAENYYAKITEQNPSKLDYLNAGHVAWAQQKRNEALQLYAKSLKIFAAENDDFYTAFEADMAQLEEAGIATDEIPLMLDKLRYMV